MKNRIVSVFAVAIVFAFWNSDLLAQWSNGRPANRVLGQPDFVTKNAPGGGASRFSNPDDVAVDPVTLKVFVSDRGNNRVLRFASMNTLTNGAAAEAVFGQSNFDDVQPNRGLPEPTAATLSLPSKLDVDANGNLWVVDTENRRVLRYANASAATTGASAVQVLGRPDFVDTPPGVRSASTMQAPRGIDFDDAANALWVACEGDNRVLYYEDPITKGNGGAADGLLGQANFTDSTAGLTAMTFDRPKGVVAGGNGIIWVSDRDNNRVLRFDGAGVKAKNAITNAVAATADGVLGQVGFTSNGTGQAANLLFSPSDVALDSAGSLWVADGTGLNRRLLRFEMPEVKVNGASADGVLGSDDFLTSVGNTTADNLSGPKGVGTDPLGNIWVAEISNDRVMRFSPGNFQPDGKIGTKVARQIGNDRYTGGAGQKVKAISKNDRKVKLFATLENDGPGQDDLSLRVTKKDRNFSIKVFDTTQGKRNVTAAASRGAYLAPGVLFEMKRNFQVLIKPKGKARGKTIKLTGTSGEQGTRDTVAGKVKVKR